MDRRVAVSGMSPRVHAAVPASQIDLARLGPNSPLRAALAGSQTARRGSQKRRREPEHEAQCEVVAWAAARVLAGQWELEWLFAVPNGGHRHPATAARLKAEGVKRGVPDLWLPIPHGGKVGCVIEMKIKPNIPTTEQLAWLDELAAVGWRTAVAYSAAEAIAVLGDYVAGRA